MGGGMGGVGMGGIGMGGMGYDVGAMSAEMASNGAPNMDSLLLS